MNIIHFGLQTSSSWTRENSNNDFLYNEGSELNKTTGWYETAYRGYDASMGRFMQVDPLAVLVANYSPYANCNPVLFNDPLGLLTESEVNDIIKRLWNSPNGGSWSASDGYYYYRSQSEAFEAGVEYNNYHNSWGQTYYKSERASREVFKNMQKNGNSYLPSPVHFKYEFNWTKKGPKYIGPGTVPDAQQGDVRSNSFHFFSAGEEKYALEYMMIAQELYGKEVSAYLG